MPLDPAAVLALAAACAPEVAPHTLLAVAQVESGLDPLAIGVNGPGGRASRPRTRAQAVEQATGLIAAGRNIDLGLAQINSRNLGGLGLSVADAFDPCRSLAASARVLAMGYRRAAPQAGREQAGLRTALSYYNTGHPTRGLANGYVARVAAAAGTAAAQAPRPIAIAAPPPAWDVFARARTRPADGFVVTTFSGAQP
ncbi:lytic transglycosylase domain-containing protein [Phenylobacterium sp.]|uniref:lytic transglycosylase domain-containing protein n=1 Tax=Phenylobacterium sp. TaxID=1871053 RepID=UPI003BAD2A9B